MRKKVLTILLALLLPLLSLYAADTRITIDASETVYQIPGTFFGSNLASWCASEDGKDPLKIEFMKATNRKLHRWPGGSWADAHIWDDMEEGGASTWKVSYEETLDFLSKIGGTMQPIVNCGGVWNGVQHTNEEAVTKAAAWVTDMNINRNMNVKIWEIGNEMHGSWEEGYCQDGAEYARRYINFYRAMKAVDSTILCGADAIETETGWNNWMALMLSEFQKEGIIPDFLIIHYYPTINQTLNESTSANCLEAVNLIETFTQNLDDMVARYFGAAYVGQIKYAMTEFNATPGDIVYLDALFNTEFMLELAKYKWMLVNPWHEDIWYREGYVRPMGYIYPFLEHKFGRELLSTSTDNAQVRAYAARDEDGNLTLFMANNSPVETFTATINISGFAPGTTGEQYLMEPYYTGWDPQIAYSTYNQHLDDVKINGHIHPDPRVLFDEVWPRFISTGSSFDVTLKGSEIAFIKIFPSGITPEPHPAPTLEPTPTPAPLSATGPVKVQYKCLETGDQTTSSRFSINVINNSDEGIPLNELTVRYWYTREGVIGWEDFHVDWAAKIPEKQISGKFSNMYHHLDISFDNTTSIVPGGESGEIQVRWNYGDNSPIDQTNDYSFSPEITSLTETSKLSLYRNGNILWGEEPEGLRPLPLLSLTSSPVLKGDANSNGTVDIVDALLTAQYYVGIEVPGFSLEAADTNCDGNVDIVDALLVAQYYVGLISQFC